LYRLRQQRTGYTFGQKGDNEPEEIFGYNAAKTIEKERVRIPILESLWQKYFPAIPLEDNKKICSPGKD
jgi:hypothetical protein